MLQNIIKEIDSKLNNIDETIKKKYNFELFLRMVRTLNDKNLLDASEECNAILDLLTETNKNLVVFIDSGYSDKQAKKLYKKGIAELREMLEKKHGLYPAGNLEERYLALGLSIGTAIGVALSTTTGPAFLAVGIGVGLSLGVSIGKQKEKDAEEKGKVY